MTLLVGSIFHMTRKIVSEMTYNVSMGMLNPTILYYYWLHMPIRLGTVSVGNLIRMQCHAAVTQAASPGAWLCPGPHTVYVTTCLVQHQVAQLIVITDRDHMMTMSR